jgi:hypothetical protein
MVTGIAPHCLDEGTVTQITVEAYNGQNWEQTYESHQNKPDSIMNWSK